MTLSKLLLCVLAPLCIATACTTSPDSTATRDDISTTESDVLAQTNGASCTVNLPLTQPGPLGVCTTTGSGPVTILDGSVQRFPYRGIRGFCQVSCTNGVVQQGCFPCNAEGNPLAAEEPAAVEAPAAVAKPAGVDNDCVQGLPITWTENGVWCRSFGGVTYMSDGDSVTYPSFGGGTGAGSCTTTCNDGTVEQSNCTCHPR